MPEIRSLPVPLTDEDLKIRGDQLAASFKGKLDAIDADISHLSTVVKERKEYRPVECEWVEHWKTYMMELKRIDTGERVDARPMSNAERQPKLFPIAGKKDDKKKTTEKGGKDGGGDAPTAA